jgi:hypothetical protein
MENDWCGLTNQREFYEEHYISANGTNLEVFRPMDVATIFVSETTSYGSNAICLRPSELPMDIESMSTVTSDIVSCPLLTPDQLPPPRPGSNYWSTVIVTNGHYKLVEYKDSYYVRLIFNDQL